jgi:hypothetical protein
MRTHVIEPSQSYCRIIKKSNSHSIMSNPNSKHRKSISENEKLEGRNSLKGSRGSKGSKGSRLNGIIYIVIIV